MVFCEKLEQQKNSPNGLSHAYVIAGRADSIVPELRTFFQYAFGIDTEGNPDFFHGVYDVFGINDSRELARRASTRAFQGDVQVFILCASSLTREAQNALLKLFEEPTEKTHFFLVVPSASLILPTLCSRCVVLDAATPNETGVEARQLLQAPIAKRTTLIAPIVKEKDRARARVLLDDIEALLHKQALVECALPELRPALRSVEMCRGYLSLRSPSVKMIMEHLVATLPQITYDKEDGV